jgi:hypothetical protein
MGSGPEFLNVEKPLLDQLGEMGWKTIAGSFVFPSVTGRASFRDVILKSDLAAALRRVNLRDGEPWLDVAAEAATDGIDFTAAVMTGLGSLSGRVVDEVTGQPIEGISIQVLDHQARFLLRVAASAADGTYRVDDLRAGDVFVATANRLGYLEEVWDDRACDPSCDFTAAPPVVIAGGEEAADVDFRLVRGGTISGRVTDEAGEPHPRLDGGHRPHAGARHRRDHGDLLRRPCSGPGARRARRRPRRRLGRLGRARP